MRFLLASLALLIASPVLAQNEDLGTAPPVKKLKLADLS